MSNAAHGELACGGAGFGADVLQIEVVEEQENGSRDDDTGAEFGVAQAAGVAQPPGIDDAVPQMGVGGVHSAFPSGRRSVFE